MKNILIVYGDPYQDNSVANRKILNLVKEQIPEIQVDDLYNLYPNYKMDVAAEQEKLKNADIIVFMSPIYWYSVDSLMHRWFEEVLTYGFAYGRSGKALEGKTGLFSLTAGGPESSYTPGPDTFLDGAQMIRPLEAILPFCSMKIEPAIISFGMPGKDPDAKAADHAARLVEAIRKNL